MVESIDKRSDSSTSKLRTALWGSVGFLLLIPLVAMQFTDEHGEVCAAGWQKGDEGMKATTEGVAEYLGKNEGKL